MPFFSLHKCQKNMKKHFFSPRVSVMLWRNFHFSLSRYNYYKEITVYSFWQKCKTTFPASYQKLLIHKQVGSLFKIAFALVFNFKNNIFDDKMYDFKNYVTMFQFKPDRNSIEMNAKLIKMHLQMVSEDYIIYT